MEALNLKINKSQIARQLNIDRRSVHKYLQGYEKPKTRKRSGYLDDFYDIISELLSNDLQIFHYKRVLWQYLVDNHGLSCPQSTFRRYISLHAEFQEYFTKSKPNNKTVPVMRFNTPPGEQAQLDWKENINFITSDGEVVVINVLVLLLSCSRFRVYKLSLSKDETMLQSLLTECFETFGGVPKTILTDNMKTVMQDSRTKYNKGTINKSMAEFSKDFGFEVMPCIDKKPQTKGKVESPMKILDEIVAYNGKLDYVGLHQLVEDINNRINSTFNQGSGSVPIMDFAKEKEFLTPLPCEKVRNSYKIATYDRKINTSAMIHYNNCQYSVPAEHIGFTAKLQVYNNNLYIYYNTKLIAMHAISTNKLNYSKKHYVDIVGQNFAHKDAQDIEDIAKRNLENIGGYYNE